MSPQSIAHYRISSKLGEGGMGAVYRATDTKLNRDVAIKVLPDSFAQDADRLARFAREALVLASLNHPNIAAIYGVEDRALVMELVEGQTLAERLGRGALPLEDALSIARQIAEALMYAHEKGVIHRDLKPANIKVTAEGRVKVLDFGLAKALRSGREPADYTDASPTLTMDGTQTGVILGTAAYMSPEQARGKAVDRRGDIWAFGVVLYEMVTGKRLFHRESQTDVFAAVLKEEPDWDRAPIETQRLLRWCLQKDPEKRLRDIGDAKLLLEEAPQVAVRRQGRAGWVAAAVFATAAAFAWWSPGHGARELDRPLIRISADLGPNAVEGVMTTASISPDGTRIVFPWRDAEGTQMLATRRLDQTEATPLAGTEGAQDQFFSPDGKWIGFASGAAIAVLKKVLIQGGAPVTLANAFTARGAAWDADGSIIGPLTNRSALVRLSAEGRGPQPVTQLEVGELSHRWPQILPGGRVVLFTARSPSLNSYENASIDAVTLQTGERKTLWRGGYFGRYLATRGSRGHLVFLHDGVLFGIPFNPERLELEGTPAPVVDNIASDPTSGGGQFDVSQNGTLVYSSGMGMRAWQMTWLDAGGKTEPVLPKAAMYYSPRFSPDGRRLAYAVEAGNGSDIFISDLQNQSEARLTFSQQGNIEPVWTPDGKHLVYRSIQPAALWWVRADGGGEPQRLRENTGEIQACSFSPDGTQLAFQERAGSNFKILILPLDLSDPEHPKAGAPKPLPISGSARYPAFSHDGRWIAYQSNESGVPEVYVRRAVEPGGKWQISADGGGYLPFWSRNGREILYLASGNRIMVVEYAVERDSFVARKPRVWSPVQILNPGYVPLDLARDGKRFAIFSHPRTSKDLTGTVHVTFLFNFFDELRRRLPARKQ